MSLELTKKIVKALDDKLARDIEVIKTEEVEKIQIALDDLEDKIYDFYIYKINEDGTLEKVKNTIKSINDKKINPNILDSCHEYFELKLDEGKYFVTYLIGEENTLFSKVILKVCMFIFGILLLGFIGSVLFILIAEKVDKKRRRRKRR